MGDIAVIIHQELRPYFATELSVEVCKRKKTRIHIQQASRDTFIYYIGHHQLRDGHTNEPEP